MASQARNQHEADDMFLQNVSYLSSEYMCYIPEDENLNIKMDYSETAFGARAWTGYICFRTDTSGGFL
jgi:hypothetical protein